jgi:hypothetical protein
MERDVDLVEALYDPESEFVAGTLSAVGPDLEILIDDFTLAEASYVVRVEQEVGGVWQQRDLFAYFVNIAPRDHSLKFWWRKYSYQADGIYRACIWPNNALFGPAFASCAGYLNLVSDPNVDSDGDGFSDLRETGVPACLDAANTDSVDDAWVNDGCPVFGGHREYDYGQDLNCQNSVNNDADQVVNDGCPQVDLFSEADIQIGSNANQKCAATPGANNDPLPDAWPLDFNDDRIVSGSDYSSFNTHMNQRPPNPGYDPRWDLNVNGLINGQDYLMLNPYGQQCTP